MFDISDTKTLPHKKETLRRKKTITYKLIYTSSLIEFCVYGEEGYLEWAGNIYIYGLHVFLSQLNVMSLKAEIIPYSFLKLQRLDNLEHRKHLARICCLNG